MLPLLMLHYIIWIKCRYDQVYHLFPIIAKRCESCSRSEGDCRVELQILTEFHALSRCPMYVKESQVCVREKLPFVFLTTDRRWNPRLLTKDALKVRVKLMIPTCPDSIMPVGGGGVRHTLHSPGQLGSPLGFA